MANSDKGRRLSSSNVSAADVARLKTGETLPLAPSPLKGKGRQVSLFQTYQRVSRRHAQLLWKVITCAVILLALIFFSLCFMGAAGQYYLGSHAYQTFTPGEVLRALGAHLQVAFAQITHLAEVPSNQWLMDNVSGYWAIWNRLGVIGIVLVCSILLSVSGMLYQNVFRNPLAGPGMLGVSGGVSLGVMILVVLYGAQAATMTGMRYLLCYGLGAAILVFVIVAGKRLSGAGRSFDTVTMLLIGSILGQLIGFIVSFVTLFVMDDADYALFYEISQMLTVDTSLLSWLCLGAAVFASFIPVYLLRFRMNALGVSDTQARLLGFSGTRLRGVALVCGAIMILAAQIHVGMVGMVSLVIPLFSRRLFGCEFTKQLTGCVCISTIFLLVCRDITDLIPFVGDGLAIGSVVSIALIPLFLLIVARETGGEK